MAKNEKTSGIENLSFEDAIKQLTDIVDKIESGRTPLQTSLEQYEQGMNLIKHCRGILQAAEKKIEKISEKNKNDKS
jgi:exodeoxyribonuclease VII small subunit